MRAGFCGFRLRCTDPCGGALSLDPRMGGLPLCSLSPNGDDVGNACGARSIWRRRQMTLTAACWVHAVRIMTTQAPRSAQSASVHGSSAIGHLSRPDVGYVRTTILSCSNDNESRRISLQFLARSEKNNAGVNAEKVAFWRHIRSLGQTSWWIWEGFFLFFCLKLTVIYSPLFCSLYKQLEITRFINQ